MRAEKLDFILCLPLKEGSIIKNNKSPLPLQTLTETKEKGPH